VQLDELVALKAQRPAPVVVVHCGSTTRAQAAFEHWRLQDTLSGMVVLTIGANKHDQALGITPEQAVDLDILHLFKIERADLVRVLNIGGYLGESTRREVEYARFLGKPVLFLEGCSADGQPLDEVDMAIETVLDLMQAYTDCSEEWVIHDGVEAWEVLYGYGKLDGASDQEMLLFAWLERLSDGVYYQVYQEFIRRWAVRYPAPIEMVGGVLEGVLDG
jgi:hypothetical protein